jgi:hypothetical protein
MRRRKSENLTLRLFAFQDIITGVSGVMLFILMILIVQLALASSQINENRQQPTVGNPEDTITDSEIETMEQLLERRQRIYEQNKIKLDMLIETSGMNLETALPQLRETEAQLRSEQAQLSVELSNLQQNNQNTGTENPIREILREIDELQQEIRQAQTETLEWQNEYRVNYQTDSVIKNLCLFDVRRAEALMIPFPFEDHEDRIDLKVSSNYLEIAAAIEKRYTELPLEKQDPQKRIVVLIRPSAAAFGEELVHDLKRRGFEVALELLEANAQLFRSRSRTSEARD